MSAIAQVFEFGGSELRTTVVNDEPWFIAADVCLILNFRMASDALRNLDEDEKGYAVVRTPGGDQRMSVVSESGLYALAFRSRNDGAKRFRKWVTSEVLPAIRKAGHYEIADQNSPVVPQSFAEALRLAADLQEQNEAQARKLEAAAPKVEYVDTFLRSTDVCLFRQYAKQIGLKEKDLRAALLDRKVIFRTPIENRFSKSRDMWVTEYRFEPATAFMSWFKEGDQPNAPRLHNGQLRTTLYVTPVGKVGIARLLDRLPSSQAAIEGAFA